MTKEMLKGLIELVSEEDIETLYNVVVKFIPENVPLPDEIEAIERADKSIAKNGTVPHDAVDGDKINLTCDLKLSVGDCKTGKEL